MGAPEHSRTQHLPIDAEQSHLPTCCAGCGQSLSAAQESRAHNARYEIDLIQPGAEGTGLQLRQTKHTYFESRCTCGHWTQAQPGRAAAEADWVIARRISLGTRTAQGTRAFAHLASVIETCRKRAASPWPASIKIPAAWSRRVRSQAILA